MPTLVACPSCNQHVRSDERACPHCGRVLRDGGGRVSATAGALLMGLSLGACADKDGNDSTSSSATVGEPEYGVAATEVEPAYGVPVDTESSSTGGEASSTGSETDTDTDGTTSIGEPEYGVPETTTGNEPDYGVPETSNG